MSYPTAYNEPNPEPREPDQDYIDQMDAYDAYLASGPHIQPLLTKEQKMRYFTMWPGGWENENTPLLSDWWAVCDEEKGGIVAYFQMEKHAEEFCKSANS